MKHASLAAAILLITLTIACGRSTSLTPTGNTESDTAVQSSPTKVTQATATRAPTSPQATATTSSNASDCGTNADCLIEASKTCEPVRATYATTVDLMGVLTYATNTLEIKGADSTTNKCIFFMKVEKAEVKFSEDAVKKLKDQGLTDGQIRAQEAQMNKQAQSTVGTQRDCKFKTDDLTAMLTRWKQGTYSTRDWDSADCTG